MKTRGKRRRLYSWRSLKQLVCGLLCVFVLWGCGKTESQENEELYGEAIASLGDDVQFALEDIGDGQRVLFTTDQTYDDGNGHNAALYCDVRCSIDGEVYDLGRIESMGTAYPVSFGNGRIYTASGHSIEIYEIDSQNHKLKEISYEERVDGEGNTYYSYTEDGNTADSSEADYQAAVEEYGKSTVLNFGYGASGR